MRGIQGKAVYLAGPMVGYPLFNFNAFEDATERLRAAGAEVTSPHEIQYAEGADPNDPAGLVEALKLDIAALLEADLVVYLEGWEDSDEASLELTVAEALRIPAVPLCRALDAIYV